MCVCARERYCISHRDDKAYVFGAIQRLKSHSNDLCVCVCVCVCVSVSLSLSVSWPAEEDWVVNDRRATGFAWFRV